MKKVKEKLEDGNKGGRERRKQLQGGEKRQKRRKGEGKLKADG